MGATTPRVSLWLTGLKETVDQLPDFVRLAARIGRAGGASAAARVRRSRATAWRAPDSSLFESTRAEEQARDRRGRGARRELGVMLDASGATEPGLSLKRQTDGHSPGRPAAGPGR